MVIVKEELRHPDTPGQPGGPHALIYKRNQTGRLKLDKDGNPIPKWRYRVEPFQQAVKQSGLSPRVLAGRAGYKDPNYVSRLLGERALPAVVRDGRTFGPYHSTSLSYENAAKIACALGLNLTEWEI